MTGCACLPEPSLRQPFRHGQKRSASSLHGRAPVAGETVTVEQMLWPVGSAESLTGSKRSAVLPKFEVEWCTPWKGTMKMLPLHQQRLS